MGETIGHGGRAGPAGARLRAGGKDGPQITSARASG